MKTNTTIKIPEKVYVGFRRNQRESNVPLGFLTPYSADVPGVRRQRTVDRWATNYSRDSSSLKSVILDNSPMYGFRISRSLRRLGWRSTNVLVRIEDPRGFELEISVSNFIMLTDNNMIHNGEIIQQCVWGRDGQENKLLPVNSEPYTQAVENTLRLSSKISVRDISIGNEILMHNGSSGTYMGSMYPFIRPHAYNNATVATARFDDKKQHIVRTVASDGKVTFTGHTSMKISRKISDNIKTKDECIAMIAEDISNKERHTLFNMAGSNYRHNTVGLFYGNDKIIKEHELIPITIDEITDKSNNTNRNVFIVIHDKANSEWAAIRRVDFALSASGNYSYVLQQTLNYGELVVTMLDSTSLDNGELGGHYLKKLMYDPQTIEFFILNTTFTDSVTKSEVTISN